MKKFLVFPIILASILVLSGCGSDPLGMAEASRQKWQAQASMAESAADARQEEAQADIAIAQIQAQANVAIEDKRAELASIQATQNYALATQSQALLREARGDGMTIFLVIAFLALAGLIVFYVVVSREQEIRRAAVAPHVLPPAPRRNRRALPTPEGWAMPEDEFVDVLLLSDKERTTK